MEVANNVALYNTRAIKAVRSFIVQTPGCLPLYGQVTALGQIRKAVQIEEHTSLLPFVVVTTIKNLYFAEP
jgi:hypothetical protein